MSCCGKQRLQVVAGAKARPRPELVPNSPRPTNVFFQYVGRTGLTALGAVTGTQYRFDSPGAVIAVDFRDQASLRMIPQLRLVHSI